MFGTFVHRKCNKKGFALTGAIVLSALGLLIITALGTYMAMISQQVSRVEALVQLNAFLQEIDTQLTYPETCGQLFQGSGPVDLGLMAQAHDATGTAKPGAPVSVNVDIQALVGSMDPLALAGETRRNLFSVEHLAFTDGLDAGIVGANGFPLHRVNLFGIFGHTSGALTRIIRAEPIRQVFVEVDSGSGQLVSCFAASGAENETGATLCQSLGGTWDANLKSCQLQTLADRTVDTTPDPVSGGTVSDPVAPPTSGGMGNFGSQPCSPYAPDSNYYPQGPARNPMPPGSVVFIRNDSGGTSLGSNRFLQCVNGSWQ